MIDFPHKALLKFNLADPAFIFGQRKPNIKLNNGHQEGSRNVQLKYLNRPLAVQVIGADLTVKGLK